MLQRTSLDFGVNAVTRFALGGIIWLAAMCADLAGQTPVNPVVPQPPTPQQTAAPQVPGAAPTDRPALADYLAKKQAIRDLDDQMTRALANAKMGIAEERRQVLQLVEDLKAKKKDTILAALEAAVAAYIEAPDKEQAVFADAVRFVRAMLSEPDGVMPFQPRRALEIAQKMTGTGTKNTATMGLMIHAASVCDEHDLALNGLNQAIAAGMPSNPEFAASITAGQQKWQRELAARERDAQANLPRVVIKTELGDLVVELFEDQAPIAVNQFVKLVEAKHYDGLPFFVVREGQIAVTGCKKGDGSTTDEYLIPGEHQREDARHHFGGTLTMYHAPEANASCQFGILLQPVLGRDGKFTAFGRVLEGLENTYQMKSYTPNSRLTNQKPVKIESITVLRKREHAYVPEQTLPLADKNNPTQIQQEKDQ